MCENLTKNIVSILAIVIVPPVTLCSCALMVYLFVSGKTTEALSVFTGLIGMSGGVSGYFFGSKSSEKATKAIIETNRAVIESREREINLLRGN